MTGGPHSALRIVLLLGAELESSALAAGLLGTAAVPDAVEVSILYSDVAPQPL